MLDVVVEDPKGVAGLGWWKWKEVVKHATTAAKVTPILRWPSLVGIRRGIGDNTFHFTCLHVPGLCVR